MDNRVIPKKPLVSVVIPCYNYAKYLPEAVSSVVSQGYPSIEIIIVNDGSTDDTGAIAKELVSKHTNLKYVYRKNGGLSAARNTGIDASSGKYIIFLDSDDKLKPQFVEKCIDALFHNPAASYAYTQMQLFEADDKVTHYPDFDIEKLKQDNFINASAFFRASMFENIRYDERLRRGFEDWEVYLTLAEGKKYGVLIDEPLLLYRKHGPGSISMTDRMIQSESVLKTKLYIQAKHIRFVGLKKWLHTLRESVLHDQFRLKGYIKSKLNIGNNSQ